MTGAGTGRRDERPSATSLRTPAGTALSSLQRIRATIAGGDADRVPVFPMIMSAAARWAGVPISRYANDPATMADCLLAAQRRVGHDAIHVSLNVTVEAEAVGASIEQPYDEPPRVVAPLLVKPADLLRLRIPDPGSDGRLPVFVEATRIVAGEAGDTVMVVPNIRGPLSMASQLRGVEQLMLDLIDDPGFVADLLAFCAEVGVVFAAALSRAGGHAIMFGDALCSPSSISPAMYRRMVQPVHAGMVRRLRADGASAVLLHVCGATQPIIGDLVATGADVIDLDSAVPLAEARAIAGSAVSLRGNVDPTTLYTGTTARILAEARRAIEAGGASRYILGSGCEVPIGTPIENLVALVDASRQAGRGQAGVAR